MKSNYQTPSIKTIRFETENILEGSGGIELPDHEWSLRRVKQSTDDSEATKSLGRIEQ